MGYTFSVRSSIVVATPFFSNSLFAGSQNNMCWNVLQKLLKAGLKWSVLVKNKHPLWAKNNTMFSQLLVNWNNNILFLCFVIIESVVLLSTRLAQVAGHWIGVIVICYAFISLKTEIQLFWIESSSLISTDGLFGWEGISVFSFETSICLYSNSSYFISTRIFYF